MQVLVEYEKGIGIHLEIQWLFKLDSLANDLVRGVRQIRTSVHPNCQLGRTEGWTDGYPFDTFELTVINSNETIDSMQLKSQTLRTHCQLFVSQSGKYPFQRSFM